MRLTLQPWRSLVGAALLASLTAKADFHAWYINEIYSNTNGTVQFVELACDEPDETALDGQRLYCSRSGQTNVFIFPGNLAGDSLNKKLLLATAGFGNLPGGVQPDYTIPANFLFLNNGRINFANVDARTYTNLPKNGTASLVRSGSSLVHAAANSPRNLAGQSGSIVPVRILSTSHTGSRFVISFATATGKNYSVEFKNRLTNASWQTLSTVAGNGALKSVTNNVATVPERFYRLKAL